MVGKLDMWFLAIFLVHFFLLFEFRAAFVVVSRRFAIGALSVFVGFDAVRQQVAVIRGRRGHSSHWQVI